MAERQVTPEEAQRLMAQAAETGHELTMKVQVIRQIGTENEVVEPEMIVASSDPEVQRMIEDLASKNN